MKQILLTLSIITLSTSLFAQEAADKKVQAGLVAGVGMNLVTMETDKLTKDGNGTDLTIGSNVNFSINETIGFSTGLEIDFTSLKYRPSGDNIYYNFSDKNILNNEEALAATDDQMYQLETRKQKATYLSIPTQLIFRTKFIGYFRYFGKFGVRTSFLVSNKTYDTGFEFPEGISNPVVGDPLKVSRVNENMSPKNEMFFMRAVGGFAGGAEWNFTGTTTLMAEMGFYFGFTPLYYSKKDEKSFLYQTEDLGTTSTYFSNAAKHNQLRFKLSILF